MPIDKSSSVLISGAVTWGLSTALHLARRGYTSITVLDPYELPSPISAGNDVNKIIELSTSFPSESDSAMQILTQHATVGWLKDPVFMPFDHNTGQIIAAHTPEGLEMMERDIAPEEEEYERLETAEAFRATMPAGVLMGDFPGWKGGFKRKGAGWAFARDSMMGCFYEAQRLGVNVITGASGNVVQLLIEDGDVRGAETGDGSKYYAETTILAAGAQAPNLVDLKDQLRPTAWTLAHIQMSPSECELYRNLPVLFNLESGFFMEPDAGNGELKICYEHAGYCNFSTASSGSKTSIPFAKQQKAKEAEERVRGFLRNAMPHLAERPFSFAEICWCADTVYRMFLFDYYPEYKSLVLAVGGSGHGFKYIPSIGAQIVDLMEGKLDPKLKESMRWRPETAVGRDFEDVLDRRGGSNRIMNFENVKEWMEIENR